MQLDILASNESKLGVDLNSVTTIYVEQRKQVCVCGHRYMSVNSQKYLESLSLGVAAKEDFMKIYFFYKVNIFV